MVLLALLGLVLVVIMKMLGTVKILLQIPHLLHMAIMVRPIQRYQNLMKDKYFILAAEVLVLHMAVLQMAQMVAI